MSVGPSGLVCRRGRGARSLRACAEAQDLVEYALLTAIVGFCCVAAWGVLENVIGDRYATLDAQTQSLWEPPEPGAAP